MHKENSMCIQPSKNIAFEEDRHLSSDMFETESILSQTIIILQETPVFFQVSLFENSK